MARKPAFPKMLQRAGYQTAILGKWHLGSDPQGYDFWRVLPGQGHYYNPRFRSPEGISQKHGYVTDIITDMTIHWLSEQRNRDKPFMLMYQHKAPHGPWQPAPKHYELYENETIPEPPTLFDNWEGRSIAPKLQDMTLEHTLQPWHVNMTGPPQRLDEAQAKRWRQAFGDLPRSFEGVGLEGKALTRWKYQHYIKNELKSVYNNPAYSRVQRRLKENLQRLRKELEVPKEDPPGSYRKSGPGRRRPLPEKYRHIEPPTP